MDGVPVLDWAKIGEHDEAARRDVQGAVKSAKFDKDRRVSFELHNKLEALAQLSKLNGFDKVEGSQRRLRAHVGIELVAELSRQANELGTRWRVGGDLGGAPHGAARAAWPRGQPERAAVLDSQSVKSAEKGAVKKMQWVTTLPRR
jgi:hypothetical protein